MDLVRSALVTHGIDVRLELGAIVCRVKGTEILRSSAKVKCLPWLVDLQRPLMNMLKTKGLRT
jgi:hypothetical protein